MSLQARIMEDIKTAMRAKDTVALEALRAIKSEILLAQTSSGSQTEISEQNEVKIVQKLVKMRKDSAKIFTEQNRLDLAEPELAQIAVIEKFLPKQYSEEEVEQIISSIIADTGAKTIADMGKVMGLATAKIAGKAEGKTISTIVKKLLVILVLFLSSFSFAQHFVDVNVGMNSTVFDAEQNSNFKHYGLGYKYLFDDVWGIKLDFALDNFEKASTQVSPVKQVRVSLQAVANLNNLLAPNSDSGNFGLLAHSGIGYGEIRATGLPGLTDHVANVLVGITPTLALSDSFGIYLDDTIVYNLSQHIDFKGNLVYNGAYPASVTKIYNNLSFGIYFKFE